jgi:hypothetical protein
MATQEATQLNTAQRLTLAMIVVAGGVGNTFDVGNIALAGHALAHHGVRMYASFDRPDRWPYPPLYVPLAALANKAAGVLHVSFSTLIRLPDVVADLALALLVEQMVAWRGATATRRLAAAAAVAVGPCVLSVSAVHGQIDVFAIAFAVAGYAAFQRFTGTKRAVAAGLLIGMGAAIKVVPGFAVLPLLPHLPDWRQRGRLLAATAAVPILSVLPFFVATPSAVKRILLGYHGLAGVGGLSLAVQPRLALFWFAHGVYHVSRVGQILQDASVWLTLAGVVAVTVVCWKWRPEPAVGASLIYLVVWICGVNYFLTYAVWGLPFFILAGYTAATVAFQAVYLVPLWFAYDGLLTHRPTLRHGNGAVEHLYVPAMLILYLAFCCAVGVLVYAMAWAQPNTPRAVPGPAVRS